MSQESTSPKNTVEQVKLPFLFDSQKLASEYENLEAEQFEYYNVIQLRAPAHLVDNSLPFPPPATDYADGSWTDWLDTKELEISPYINSVIETFKKHTNVTLVRLLRLAPKSIVKEHTDPTLGLHIEKSVVRLTIPIINNEDVKFFLNEKEVPMKVGECWYLNLTNPHRVVNDGKTERVNLSIDMIPNDWVRNMILNKK